MERIPAVEVEYENSQGDLRIAMFPDWNAALDYIEETGNGRARAMMLTPETAQMWAVI